MTTLDLDDLLTMPAESKPRRKRGRPPASAEELERRAMAVQLAEEEVFPPGKVALLAGVTIRCLQYWRAKNRKAS